MKLDTGTIITIAVILLFYLRLIIIQRERIKRAKYQYSQVAKMNAKKKKMSGDVLEVNYKRLGIRIRNWWLVGVGLALILFGAIVIGTKFLGPSLSSFWWIPLNTGVILFAIGIN